MSALLEVDDLNVRYGGVHAVSDVRMRVDEGSVVGLIGPNGAGKTSMIDALTGYYRPASGRVRFAGEDITSVRPHRRAQARPRADVPIDRAVRRSHRRGEPPGRIGRRDHGAGAGGAAARAPADARSDRLGAIGVRARRRRRALAQGSFARAAQARGRCSRAGAAAAPGPDGRAGGRAGHERDRGARHDICARSPPRA